MGLFQTSVLKKYRKLQDKNAVEKAYKIYADYFHNSEIQENIRESKEEQFQEGFLREFFVKVFDYTLNPKPQFNLTTELKNERGAKKADGAILKDGKALAVIELKSTKTKDLESIRQQAFDYKANQSACVYVITSNFEKLRFYINNAVDFEEFNLFTLKEEQFELLYLCLHKENILNNVPLKIKTDSVVAEESITKKFYSDYSLFKRELFRDLVKQNLNNEVFKNELQKEDKDQATKNIKLSLFKKSQKLIDRFLFIFFAEDKGLLPPNSTLRILKDWDKLNELDTDIPLYNRFKLYFKYLDEGRKGTNGKAEIFAYNGGLFKPDPILDSLILDNQLLYKHTKILSDYDFESQVGVNILGHIFENSLNEIESINAEIEGTDFDKQKTKRKKDGVFYTPKYITKYIVDNTVGKLCEEKKQELEIEENEYHKSRKGRKTETIKKLKAKLTDYRNWLLSLTILDPACGSGAFLNQALDFLIKEHTYIDELETSLFGGGMVFQNIENTILENNIFGVDLNEESVEIAKLSLWLRTAQPRRKLNTLNDNIKCGNSLIDDPKVAGDKAFNWQNEFTKVFKNGGFDVVIGNPPYAGRSSSINNDEKVFVKKNYITAEGKFELYQLFIEKCFELSKKNESSFISLITPQTWLSIIQATKLRKFVLVEKELSEIVFLGKNVFEEASVDSVIFIIHRSKTYDEIKFLNSNSLLNLNLKNTIIEYNNIENTSYIIPISNNSNSSRVSEKILRNSISMESIGKWSDGVKVVGPAKSFAFQTTKHNESFFPMLVGKDIEKYSFIWGGLFCCRDKKSIEKHNATDIRLRDESMFHREKILIRKTGSEIAATIDNEKFYYEQSLFSYGLINDSYDLDSILGIINSKMANFLLKENAFSKKDTFPQIRLHWLKDFPVPKYIPNSNLKNTVTLRKKKQITLIDLIRRFTKYLQSQYNIEKLSKKLQNWHELEFAEFIKELNKTIKKVSGEKLTKKDEMEWMELFEEKKAETQTLKTEIEKTDKEIDQMVYELYGLTEDEIMIIENEEMKK